MGLIKKLEEKFGSREKESDSPRKAYEKAQEIKQQQEEYEAEQKGFKQERLRQAKAKGRARAKGNSGSGGSFFKTVGAIGDFGTGMAKSFGADMFTPPPRPKPKVKKQVVVVKVVGAGGATKQTRKRTTKKKDRYPSIAW